MVPGGSRSACATCTTPSKRTALGAGTLFSSSRSCAMPRFYVSIADANRILDTCQECLTLEHAKKLAVQTVEELARNKDCLPTQRKARLGHG